MARRPETELYGPVKAFLEGLGYEVKGEVGGCDLMAVRGDAILLVELKSSFNLDLVLQGVERLRAAESVYLAVEAPRGRTGGPRWTAIRHLCRRLGLGLITVSFAGRTPRVEPVCDPGDPLPRREPKKQAQLLKEFRRRTGDRNVGGSTRRPLMTAYREEALRIARCLSQGGPANLKSLRAVSNNPEGLQQMLQKDYYGWFERVGRGVYRLTARGEQALVQFAGPPDARA